jgi:hypothetical protein
VRKGTTRKRRSMEDGVIRGRSTFLQFSLLCAATTAAMIRTGSEAFYIKKTWSRLGSMKYGAVRRDGAYAETESIDDLQGYHSTSPPFNRQYLIESTTYLILHRPALTKHRNRIRKKKTIQLSRALFRSSATKTIYVHIATSTYLDEENHFCVVMAKVYM